MDLWPYVVKKKLYKYGLERVRIYATPDTTMQLLSDYSVDINLGSRISDDSNVVRTETELRNAAFNRPIEHGDEGGIYQRP